MKWRQPPSSEQAFWSPTLRVLLVSLAFVTSLNVLLPIFVPTPMAIPLSPDVHVKLTTDFSDENPRELPIPPLKPVALTVEDSINFQLDTPEGAAQWRAIIPPGDGYIILGSGPNRRRYRISMFHALDCLDTIRHEILERKAHTDIPTSQEARYCLDYIRQTILCRSDIQLEQVRSEYGGKSVQPFITHNNCRDWTAVYAEVEKLHAQAGLEIDQ